MTTSVIEASSGTYRSRVDGTLVLSVEIEPRHARDAIALFGDHGTPMALAALKPSKTQGHETESEARPERERLGGLCWWAVQRCKEPEFQCWLGGSGADEKYVTERIYAYCNIKSRKELDTNKDAAAIFRAKVMEPYRRHLAKQGVTA